jgi:radical SAM superfamily enzyme YgiQ (UPF0313 family)
MRILLYNPDNGVTRNFMPHLWMFLLQALTPEGHEVLLVDGNARAMDDDELVRFAREQNVGLVGIGAMTRMIAKAYRVADALRASGVPVVMGGPHVTECPDEALGKDGGPRHADAVALGEADETWPLIVEDAARGELKEVYQPERDAKGLDKKPSLQPYPNIPWETLDLDQFSLVPKMFRPFLSKMGAGWGKFHVVPLETGRGCPYGSGDRVLAAGAARLRPAHAVPGHPALREVGEGGPACATQTLARLRALRDGARASEDDD